MDVRVETLPSYRLAYVRQIGPYGPANVQAMEELKSWAREKGLLTESAVLFGIPQDNPQITPPEQCRYDACITITEEEQMDDFVCESKLDGRCLESNIQQRMFKEHGQKLFQPYTAWGFN